MPRDERLQSAIQHHRAGRFADAERIYREILKSQPANADALHLLGVLTGQRGDVDSAIDLIQRSIHHNPGYAEAYRNLASLLITRGGFAEAAATFQRLLERRPTDCPSHREIGAKFAANPDFQAAISALSKAIELNPNFAEAHNDRGTLLSIMNRLKDAASDHSRAATLKPAFAEAHYSLANVLARQGNVAEALPAYRRAIEINPNYADANLNLGNLLRRTGDIPAAIDAYTRAIKSRPDSAVGYFNLGQALRSASQLDRALDAFRRAVQIRPDDGQAHLAIASALADLQRFDEARSSQARAAQLMPGSADPFDALGRIELQQSNPRAASEHFRRAIAIDPTLDTAWDGLGISLQSLGNFTEAAQCFRKRLELCDESEIGATYVNLTNTGEISATPDEFSSLSKILNDPAASINNRISAGFSLGKILDAAQRYDGAFAAYSRANHLAKELRESLGDRYDPRAAHDEITRIIQTFTADFLARFPRGDPSDLPVFVVGMPRSGTTLVQQIAASHPDVVGAGELKEPSLLAQKLANDYSGRNLSSVRTGAARHLQSLRDRHPKALRVIDKTPSNIRWLGQIAILFPGARVIFCRRDPLDTCLSCFFQGFTQGNNFSFDLLHCGHEYLETERLRDHWLQTLPLKMLEIQYESLVANLENQSRRLIDFLGLPWNPAVLEFQKADTPVFTASAWQVRQPLYQSSVDRWRHYERHLLRLRELVGGQ